MKKNGGTTATEWRRVRNRALHLSSALGVEWVDVYLRDGNQNTRHSGSFRNKRSR